MSERTICSHHLMLLTWLKHMVVGQHPILETGRLQVSRNCHRHSWWEKCDPKKTEKPFRLAGKTFLTTKIQVAVIQLAKATMAWTLMLLFVLHLIHIDLGEVSHIGPLVSFQVPVQLSRLTVCDHKLNPMWHYNKPLPPVLQRFTPLSNGSRLIAVANRGANSWSGHQTMLTLFFSLEN